MARQEAAADAVRALDAWADSAGPESGRGWTLKRYVTTRGVSYVVNWYDLETRFERECAGNTADEARAKAAALIKAATQPHDKYAGRPEHDVRGWEPR